MLRRNFLALTGAGLAAGALSSCAGTDWSIGKHDIDEDAPVTELVWWSNHPGSSKDVELELIARWEEQHPELPVRLIDGGKDYAEIAQKFNAALTGSDLPDIVVLSDVWWYNFAINGQITPVSKFTQAAGVDTSTYVSSLYEDYLYNDEHYAFPFARSTPLFYYNPESWRAAGLPDRGPDSWEEMAQWGELLRTATPRQRPLGWYDAANNLSWVMQGLLWTFRGGYSDDWNFTMTSPETLQGLDWFLQATDPSKGFSATSANLAVDFAAGLTACGVLSTGDLGGIADQADFEFHTAALPNPLGTGGCPTGGAGLAIPENISERRKIAATQFIDFITNAENTAYWSQEVGYMPVRTTASDIPSQQKFLAQNPNYQSAIDQLPATRPQDNARIAIPGADPRIGGALEKIAVGRQDPEQVFEQLESTLEGIYENQVAPHLT